MNVLFVIFCIFLSVTCLSAETIRVATYNAALNRKAVGAVLNDIKKGNDPQIAAVIEVIKRVHPDILLINEIDHDGGLETLSAFQAVLADAGVAYAYRFAPAQNVGEPSWVDLNGNGKFGEPTDAYGFGFYPGQYAMALLSKFPIMEENARDFRKGLWRDLEWANRPKNTDGTDWLSAEALDVFRFSSKAHWDVPLIINGKQLNILASHPTPPVFDGPEDLNGLRNAAEIGFWVHYLDGDMEERFNGAYFVILGDLNADPNDGDGRREVIETLLSHPLLQDPKPKSEGGRAAALQGGKNTTHRGDPALDTADWNDASSGNLRVDYVLPSANLEVVGSGVEWPEGDEVVKDASDHRLVWVDIAFGSN